MSGTILLVLRLVMAIALYAFLGWAILTLWRDIKHQSEFIAARQIPRMKLIRDIDEEKKVYEFKVPELVIGRDQRCDLRLEESTVSAEHARLSYHNGNWWVEDLQSRNGTLLNLELITTSTVVTSGDELQIGQVLLRIEISGSPQGMVSHS